MTVNAYQPDMTAGDFNIVTLTN